MIFLFVVMVMVLWMIDIDMILVRIWFLFCGIFDVKFGEGCWNLFQNVIGIFCLIGVYMVGEGVGVDCYVNWGVQIWFCEWIMQWQFGWVLFWCFIFDDVCGWVMIDCYLMLNSFYFQVMIGGYWMELLGFVWMWVILDICYWIIMLVNVYFEFWG